MEDLYLKILEKLSKNGVGQEVEISDLFDGYFLDKPQKEIEQTDEGFVEQGDLEYTINLLTHSRGDKICVFLQKMADSKHLSYSNKSPKPTGDFDWAKASIKIMAQITKEGLDYYYNRALQKSTLSINEANYKLISSNLDLNIAIKENLKTQKILSRITVVVACLAAVFSVLGFFKAEPKMAELNKNIQELSKETKGIKVEIHGVRHQIAFPTASPRKP